MDKLFFKALFFSMIIFLHRLLLVSLLWRYVFVITVIQLNLIFFKQSMFEGAKAFNNDISSWNVSGVINFHVSFANWGITWTNIYFLFRECFLALLVLVSIYVLRLICVKLNMTTILWKITLIIMFWIPSQTQFCMVKLICEIAQKLYH